MGRVTVKGDWSYVLDTETGEKVFIAWPMEPTEVEAVLAMRECYLWIAAEGKSSKRFKVVRQYTNPEDRC